MGNKRVKAEYFTSDLKQEEMLSELVHRIAHEIGNPLTAIIAFSSLVPLEEKKEKIEEHCQSIRSEAWKINSLNEKLVLLLGRSTENPEFCCVGRSLEAAKNKLETRNSIKDLNIQYSALGESLEVQIDQTQFIVLLTELMLNAHKFNSHKEKLVNCHARRTADNQIEITLSNQTKQKITGELSDLFLPFVCGSDDGKHLGLGLTLANIVSQRFKGELSISQKETAEEILFFVHLEFPAG